MKNLQKKSFLVVSSLWLSFAADAMNSDLIFSNQESLSSSGKYHRIISDQENIDPNDCRPTKKQKIEDYNGFGKCDSNPLFTPKKIEAGEILG